MNETKLVYCQYLKTDVELIPLTKELLCKGFALPTNVFKRELVKAFKNVMEAIFYINGNTCIPTNYLLNISTLKFQREFELTFQQPQ